MSERYTCWVRIPTELCPQLENIIPSDFSFHSYKAFKKPDLTEYVFDEVKWGELDFLDELHEQGIPFTFSNDAIEDNRTIHCRFTSDGEVILQDYLESEVMIDGQVFILNVDDCKTPEEKLDLINRLYMEMSNKLHSLPWDNQIEYGKLYRTRQLIDPTQFI